VIFVNFSRIHSREYRKHDTRRTLKWGPLFLVFFIFVGSFFLSPDDAFAYSLTYVSDTVQSSSAGASTTHTIIFSPAVPIPPSGKIVISPEGPGFSIPAEFDRNDVDIATSSDLLGTTTERALATTSSATDDGFSVVSGNNGYFTITLNSSYGIDAGNFVRLKLGTNATFGGTGNSDWTNPSATGSYRIMIQTFDPADAELDRGKAMIAIVEPVGVFASREDIVPPVRSNGLPSGALSHTVTNVEISLNTDEYSICRYSTSAGVSYDSMTNDFTVTRSLLHRTITGAVSQGASYTYYVRCTDLNGNENTDDFPISFSINSEPLPPPPPAKSFPPGAGGGPGGSSPYPAIPSVPELVINGFAYPGASVVILKDGVQAKLFNADSQARFSTTMSDLEQGTYTFGVYARDSGNRKSSTRSYTVLLVAGTKTSISNIFLEPTVTLAKNTLDPGDALLSYGQSVPGSAVEGVIYPQSQGSIEGSQTLTEETEADEAGLWELSFDTNGLGVDTYIFRARSIAASIGSSEFSPPAYFGIGKAPAPDFCGRSDINHDGRVQLIDFSIMLVHWGSSDPTADINLDGRVSLTDFSIMLTCWTG